MKRLHKGISLVLCLCLLLGLLAGCAGKPADKDITAATDPSLQTGTQMALDPKNTLIPNVDKSAPGGQAKEYTLMVYMVGSDLETNGGCATDDLMEMLYSGLRGTNVNLLVYTGGAASWQANIRSDVNTVFALNDAGDTLEDVACTYGPENMGDPNTLWSFLDYAVTYYPAAMYSLILWDHGGGPLYGFGSDELFQYDALTLGEMEDALQNSYFAQQPLEFLGFDACLMSSLEVCSQLGRFSKYIVASEETEPGSGWDYSFLSVFNGGVYDAPIIIEQILTTYEASMLASPWQPEYTLSCIDTFGLEVLQVQLNQFWPLLETSIDNGGFNNAAWARDNAKRVGLSAVSSLGTSLDLIDLGSFLDRWSDEEARNARRYLDAAVVGHVTNVQGDTGLSIYFPYDNKNLYENGGYTCQDFVMMGSYTGVVDAFTRCWMGNDPYRFTPQTLQVQEDTLEITLTPEQLENLGSVTYSVLEYDPQMEGYFPVLTECRVQPDDNGTVSISRNPDVFCLYTDMEFPGETGALWPVTMTESTEDADRYVTRDTMMYAALNVSRWVQVAFSHDKASGQVSVQNVLYTDQAMTEMYGKQDVDLAHWDAIAYRWNPRLPTYDNDGNLLPWNQWSSDGYIVIPQWSYDEGFRLEKTPLQSREGVFHCQIVIRDTAGNVVHTQLEELCTNTPREKTLSLAEGTLTVQLYEDHAVIAGFAQKESCAALEEGYALTLPDTVEGLPVTAIGSEAFMRANIREVTLPEGLQSVGNSAFYYCSKLTALELPGSVQTLGGSALCMTAVEQVNLPEGLLAIGSNCFAYTPLKTVTLPASLAFLGAGAFSPCDNLEAIAVAPGSSAFKSVDGVVFTADGTRLLAYPTGGSATYTVPAGTVTIGENAFYGNDDLTAVTLPEGLRSVLTSAFEGTALQKLELPDSLEIIGHRAFSSGSFYTLGAENTPFTLHLGPNVRWVGEEAFKYHSIQAYSVDPANEYYAANGDCLTNASGTQLLMVPTTVTGTLTVPEGVSYIGANVFGTANTIAELVLPDSLVVVDRQAGVPYGLETVTAGRSLMDWQNLTGFYGVKTLAISQENPYYKTGADGSIYSADGTVLHLYRGTGEYFAVPEGVTTISDAAFTSKFGDKTLKQLHFPASLETFQRGNLSDVLQGLEAITVAEGNKTFAAWDGMLYSADGATLLYCPNGKTGTVTVREGTREIGREAFPFHLQADTVVLPEGVTALRQYNFQRWEKPLTVYLPASLTDIWEPTFENLSDQQHQTLTVYCPDGSYAAEYLARMGVKAQDA